VLGIDLRESVETVRNFRDTHNLTFPLLIDSDYSVWNQYGMGYIPHNVVISPDWVVRYTNYGYDKQTIIQTIEAWLPSSVPDTEPEGPPGFSLLQNYPNPLILGRAGLGRAGPGAIEGGHTTISFTLDQPSPVELSIYNLRGELIKRLVADHLSPGLHTVQWDGRDETGRIVPAGIYFYRLQAGTRVATHRLIVLP